MVNNRTIDAINPEAALESQDYIDGCIKGFHECAIDLAVRQPRGDENLDKAIIWHKGQHPNAYSNDWYRGFRECYAIRRLRGK